MRYALFAGQHYYPDGGMNDLRGSFDTFEAAAAEAHVRTDFGTYKFDWYHIVDKTTFDIIFKERLA